MDYIWTTAPRMPDLPGEWLPMQQHETYGAALAVEGARRRIVELRDRDGICGAAQVILRRFPCLGDVALLERGPVWLDRVPERRRPGTLARLVERLRAEHRGVMARVERWHGHDPLAGRGWLELVTPGKLARLDLTPGVAGLRAGLHGKWRNGLVRAERAGVQVVDLPLPPDPGHWLLEVEAVRSRGRGHAGLPVRFTHAWATAGGAGATRLFAARVDGCTVAAMLFLLHGAGASYHIGWSGALGRDLQAHRLLLWHAMRWLSERGCTRLDLGTLDTETAPGLARFKLGTGARPVSLGSAWLSAPGTAAVARLAEALRRPEPGLPPAGTAQIG